MAGPTGKDSTPAMQQWRRCKEQHPGYVVFFRMGDFYEMFYEDAQLAHRVLGVTLTQRTAGIPMAGVPYHSVERYLHRMIRAGHCVAVCDQVEDPAQAKGVVRRRVTRLITPGTLTDESLLQDETENPLAAVVWQEQRCSDGGAAAASLAWAELSTGSFRVTTVGCDELADELARINPRELLYVEPAQGGRPEGVRALAQSLGCVVTGRPAWQFRPAEAVEVLCKQFQVVTLEGFGFGTDDPAVRAAGGVVHYLRETQRVGLSDAVAVGDSDGGDGDADADADKNPASAPGLAHLQPPRRLDRADYMVVDQASLRSLEIEKTLRSGRTEGSLLGVMQGCLTAMGKRTLRQWLCYPLCRREPIEIRQRVVAAMVGDERFGTHVRRALPAVQDVSRIMGRVAVGRASPRDLVGLGRSVNQAPTLAGLLKDRPAVSHLDEQLTEVSAALTDLGGLIAAACVDDPPGHLREGGLIRDGYDGPLDESRELQHHSHRWLASYQQQLADQAGVGLKVGYNKVFGYYIEVTAANRDRVPTEWTRKQTLKNAERFITPELKQFEDKVLCARQQAVAREQDLFAHLCAKAQEHLQPVRRFAEVVAELDVLACLADRARRHRYVRPRIVDEPVLRVQGGRHPVLDVVLGDRFVPNDVGLRPTHAAPGHAPGHASGATEEESGTSADHPATLAMITGPNMAGKSTYIRQAALITLLAHTGGFVPAQAATVGLCDRIFTRVGASDELHAGQSTFMVEMTETANLCHHATDKSLVILDEIGRGTGTLDGLSLAWAIAEHLAQRGCRTLFATHYHELTGLSESLDNVINLNVSVREWQDQVVFLHRIVPGATDRSYGIHVAKIAGLPDRVVRRARQLLGQLAVNHQPTVVGLATGLGPDRAGGERGQLALLQPAVEHPVVQALRQVDLDGLSPLGAFDTLRRFKEVVLADAHHADPYPPPLHVRGGRPVAQQGSRGTGHGLSEHPDADDPPQRTAHRSAPAGEPV